MIHFLYNINCKIIARFFSNYINVERVGKQYGKTVKLTEPTQLFYVVES